MNKLLIAFLLACVYMLWAMYLLNAHFCYFPWVEDLGPGTVGCFYSSK